MRKIRQAVVSFAAVTVALICLPGHAAPPASLSPHAQPGPAAKQWEDAIVLSWFGERPTFSPDGKRVAFVDKQFGNAFEIDIATRRIRNLTGNLPHQGIIRVQYLPNGDFLLTAPRMLLGPETRFKGAGLWVLKSDLAHGLMPLDQLVMEGVAVSRRSNRIAFTELPGGNSTSEFYTADIAYEGGQARLVNRQRVIREKPCMGETQDFRNADREITFTCYARREPGRGEQAGVYGVDIASGKVTRYRDRDEEYNEVEGIAPDGSWTAVECTARIDKGLAPIDICRLELTEDGPYRLLFKGTQANSRRKANNPVISPDGKWMVLSSSNAALEEGEGNAGRGDGILLLRL